MREGTPVKETPRANCESSIYHGMLRNMLLPTDPTVPETREPKLASVVADWRCVMNSRAGEKDENNLSGATRGFFFFILVCISSL